MGSKSGESVNRMFALTDSFVVVHIIRRSDLLVRLRSRGNLLAVLRRHGRQTDFTVLHAKINNVAKTLKVKRSANYNTHAHSSISRVSRC